MNGTPHPARGTDMGNRVCIDMGNSFHFICGLLCGHVVQRNVFGNSAAAVCEVGFEGPTKHVAAVSVVWDQSQERLQMEAAFRAGGAWRPSGPVPTPTAFATTNSAEMVGAYSADAATASELGQSQACGWIAQGISRRACAGGSDDRQVAEGDETESVWEPTLSAGSTTQAKVSDGGSPEQSGLDCGFQRLVSDPQWAARISADCAGSFQSLLADRSAAQAFALDGSKTYFSSTVSRPWLPQNHPGGQWSALRIDRAAWAFAPERMVDGSGNPRGIYRSRTSRTEWWARTNASGIQGRNDPTAFQTPASPATTHRPLGWSLQSGSTTPRIGAKGAGRGLPSLSVDAVAEDPLELFEPVGGTLGEEQRTNQVARPKALYRRSIRRISDRPEVGGQRKICRLFCWLGDRRALGLGRRGYATGTVQAPVLKKCQDGHLRPAWWYPEPLERTRCVTHVYARSVTHVCARYHP
jgi:hypothetical protein